MAQPFLNQKPFPYCPGCGHSLILKGLAKALESLEIDPLDVVLVSDIGCCGLIDGLVNCHAVHGLHGRSTALAQGVAMSLADPRKKVLAVLGDGGATIGLQHLLVAARYNIDMTIILHNNLVYGMTGGQRSGLSPQELGERASDAAVVPPMDVCALVASAGASLVRRLFVDDDLESALAEAIATPGFALVEIVENCPSHGVRKMAELRQFSAHQVMALRRTAPVFHSNRSLKASLFDKLLRVEATVVSSLRDSVQLALAGSAGEGVQSAGELAAQAALTCGLEAEKRGEYPVTVATGFSLVHLTFARAPVDYTDVQRPDVVIITSQAGLQKAAVLLRDDSQVIIDDSLTAAKGMITSAPFRETVGAKGAALAALLYWGETTGVLPLKAFEQVIAPHKHAAKIMATLNRVREKWFAG